YLRCVFSLLLLSPPSSTLFPYTTLFRSDQSRARRAAPDRAGRRMGRGDVGVAFGARVAVPPGRGGRHDGAVGAFGSAAHAHIAGDRKSTRLNSSHVKISYAVFCLKKKN